MVGYEPAEAVSKIKGGNSNWRGPIWFPTCFLLIESLRKLGKAYGPTFTVPTPGSGGQPLTLPARWPRDRRPADRASSRATSDGRRPVYGGTTKFQDDPHWRDLILFYEYFHGDNGAGLGAVAPDGLDGAGGVADRRVAEQVNQGRAIHVATVPLDKETLKRALKRSAGGDDSGATRTPA